VTTRWESTIREIRQVLGDRGRTQRLIQTLHGRGRGYRFVAAVEERPTSPPESVAQPSDNRFDHLDIPLPTAATPHAPALRATTPQLSPPRHLADTILAMRRALEGERKQVTVLCATVVGFSTLAERLAPDDLHTLMGGCFTLLAEQVHRYEGVINQFTSDGMMALFGAPIVHEDHAVRALLTALGIQTALREYQGEIERGWEVPLQMHLGLHTGTVIVGRIGDNLQMHYTVQGDTTSLAAQMQQMAPPGAI